LETKILNDGSGVDLKMDKKDKFKTFDYFGSLDEEISTKSVGLGLSTADALA
jgi:K+-sensing histidine kinase KdpD